MLADIGGRYWEIVVLESFHWLRISGFGAVIKGAQRLMNIPLEEEDVYTITVLFNRSQRRRKGKEGESQLSWDIRTSSRVLERYESMGPWILPCG